MNNVSIVFVQLCICHNMVVSSIYYYLCCFHGVCGWCVCVCVVCCGVCLYLCGCHCIPVAITLYFCWHNYFFSSPTSFVHHNKMSLFFYLTFFIFPLDDMELANNNITFCTYPVFMCSVSISTN